MTISMFQASVPTFITMMNGVAHCLKKAELYADQNNKPHEALISAQLAPDMYPLKNQVFIITDQAKGCVSRLANKEIPVYPDTEETFAQLQGRLQKCMDYVAGFTPAALEGSENRDIHLKLGTFEMDFKGRDYLMGFVLPNFYFHVTTAYAILRHHGVPLGKADFFGQ